MLDSFPRGGGLLGRQACSSAGLLCCMPLHGLHQAPTQVPVVRSSLPLPQEEVPAAEQRAWVAALLQPLVAQIDQNLRLAVDGTPLLPGSPPPGHLIQAREHAGCMLACLAA